MSKISNRIIYSMSVFYNNCIVIDKPILHSNTYNLPCQGSQVTSFKFSILIYLHCSKYLYLITDPISRVSQLGTFANMPMFIMLVMPIVELVGKNGFIALIKCN